MFVLHGQLLQVDVKAALDGGDWTLAVEAASLALKEIGFCGFALLGYLDARYESDVNVALVALDHVSVDGITIMPSPLHADESSALRAAEIAFAAARVAAAWTPICFPHMRTPIFPTVHTASDLDRLREQVGIPRVFGRGWIP